LSNFAASLAGLPAQSSAVTQAAFQVISSRKLLFREEAALRFREDVGPYFATLDERPPALPVLAVRAARRAVAADPNDANAWFRLGQAYVLLRDFTCERSAEGRLPPLAQLRHVQIATALEQAVRLDPNLEAAHGVLADLYGSSNALDQSLEHRREELRLSRQAGPIPGETAKDFAYRIELFDKNTAKLVALVEANRKQFADSARSFQGDRIAQARQALRRWGLGKQAVDEILMTTPADVLAGDGIRLELDLLLSLGRAQEVRDILNDRGLRASKHGLGISEVPPPVARDNVWFYRAPYRWPAYEWLHVLEAASVGDYAQCRDDLRGIRAAQQANQEQLRLQGRALEGSIRALLPSLVTGPSVYLPAFTALALAHAVEQNKENEANLQSLDGQQADVCVLEGMLALEQGGLEAARAAFAEALKLGTDVPFAGRPIAAVYLGKLPR
jgi:tetratricopeptide (TPR) repeat protein